MKFLIVATVLLMGLATAASTLVDETNPAKATVKLLGGYQTRTRFSVLSSTTFKTCITVLGQKAKCQGRKKREAKVLGQKLMDAEGVREILLDSSQGEEKPAAPEAKNNNSGKLFVALSTFTTMTTTMYFENSSTTVSVSFHCIPPDGINYAFC